jgi:hypothetical protein
VGSRGGGRFGWAGGSVFVRGRRIEGSRAAREIETICAERDEHPDLRLGVVHELSTDVDPVQLGSARMAAGQRDGEIHERHVVQPGADQPHAFHVTPDVATKAPMPSAGSSTDSLRITRRSVGAPLRPVHVDRRQPAHVHSDLARGSPGPTLGCGEAVQSVAEAP